MRGRPALLTFFHQEIAGEGRALREADRLCYTFFHQEIAGEGQALRQCRLALLPWDLQPKGDYR